MDAEQKKIQNNNSSADEERGMDNIRTLDSRKQGSTDVDNDTGKNTADNAPVYNAKQMFQQVRISD